MNSKDVIYGVLITEIEYGTDALYLMWYATNSKIAELEKIEFFDSSLSRRANKYRMKEFYGIIHTYREKLNESLILGIAKLIEDVIFSINIHTNKKINFWRLNKNLKYYSNAKLMRLLSNIIKHHRSVIIKNSSTDANQLIEEFGFQDNFPLHLLEEVEIEGRKIDFVSLLYKTNIFLHNMICDILSIAETIDEVNENEVYKYMMDTRLPELLRENNT